MNRPQRGEGVGPLGGGGGVGVVVGRWLRGWGGNAGMSSFVHCYTSEVYFQKHLNF